jgi:hypothetical protein
MDRNTMGRVVIISIFASVFIWIIYAALTPEKIYKVGQKHPSVEIILKEKPYFHYIGLDQPFYYDLEAKNYPNSFRISNFVLDLVQDNDSISESIKKLNGGDTILINIDTLDFTGLNKNSENVEILGLTIKNNLIIDTDKIEKYQRKNKSDRVFSYLAITVILFFIFRKQIKSKRKSEV